MLVTRAQNLGSSRKVPAHLRKGVALRDEAEKSMLLELKGLALEYFFRLFFAQHPKKTHWFWKQPQILSPFEQQLSSENCPKGTETPCFDPCNADCKVPLQKSLNSLAHWENVLNRWILPNRHFWLLLSKDVDLGQKKFIITLFSTLFDFFYVRGYATVIQITQSFFM